MGLGRQGVEEPPQVTEGLEGKEKKRLTKRSRVDIRKLIVLFSAQKKSKKKTKETKEESEVKRRIGVSDDRCGCTPISTYERS